MESYKVELLVSRIHKYNIDANSSDEAISIAEQCLEEADQGYVSDRDWEILSVDAYPLEETETESSN